MKFCKTLVFIAALMLVFTFTACEREILPDPDTCGPDCVGGDHSNCADFAIPTGTAPPSIPYTDPTPPPKEIPFPGYTPTDHEMRDIPSLELIKEIKTGWNLGNTFDAPTEMAWDNPVTTYTMIQAVKDAGFDSVRLPVTWDTHTGDAPDYEIDEAWFDRVEEVVGYVLALDMYCILNTHHEDWIIPNDEYEGENTERLLALWKQLCERFANYNEKLIFESMNEPRLIDTEHEWNGGTPEAREVINRLNDAFVETVRASGGNNAIRHLMIPSYAASSEFEAMQALSQNFPDDDKVIASIHAYVPHNFALEKQGSGVWNAQLHGDQINWMFGDIKRFFLDKDIPIIMGETGAMIKDGNIEDRLEWTKHYFGKARELGIPTYWWDNGLFEGDCELFGLLDRQQVKFVFPEIIDAIMDN